MISFFQVDAFTQQPFHGNTAGVVIMDEEMSQETMRKIARQNNLPATAFAQVMQNEVNIRWFTSLAEIPLCGHASLATAHILFSKGFISKDQKITFKTKNGSLYADWINEWICLDFPSYKNEPDEMPSGLADTFSRKVKAVSKTTNRYIIELVNENEVRDYKPDFDALKNYRCILTSKANSQASYDFVSRYFASPDGIAEDAVTGSSHCSLAPYWAERLNKTQLNALQVSERGGALKVNLRDGRVYISGQAVTVIEGKFTL